MGLAVEKAGWQTKRTFFVQNKSRAKDMFYNCWPGEFLFWYDFLVKPVIYCVISLYKSRTDTYLLQWYLNVGEVEEDKKMGNKGKQQHFRRKET